MLPLGDEWVGLCRAGEGPACEPDAHSLSTVCNLGYARGACERFPVDAAGADAVRFTVARDNEVDVAVYYVMERDHHPFAHGGLEYSRATADFVSLPATANLHRQASAYVSSYLRRKAEAAGS
jgi:hypothetical protein